jgi:hypothetical protein
MRVRVPGTVLAVLALIGLGAGCAQQVHAAGRPDPAMVVTTTDPAPTQTTDAPTTGSLPTPSLPLPSAPTLDPTAERRITCLLITPSLSSAITAWNNFVDKKGGTRTSVAGVLTSSATQIDGVLTTSNLGSKDPVRGWAVKVSSTLKSMAATLRAGSTPQVGPFNTYKTKLQQACAA